MNQKNIYPSILDANPNNLINLLNIFKDNHINGIHIDVMDGNYVPSFGFNERFVKWIKDNTNFYQDIHLMVTNPENAIEKFADAGANSITVHFNTLNDSYYLISKLNDLGINSGMALNPGENPEILKEVLPMLNHVLVMTCNPGRPSNGSIISMNKKVNWLNQYREVHKLNFRIEVDGGITSGNAKIFADAGCDDFVSGGFLTKTDKINEHISQLKSILK